jgi:hypothetical protein
MKNNYERAMLTVVTFDAKDIITTSGETDGKGGAIQLPEDIF